MPKISLCQLSFPFTTLEEDIAIAQAVGASGLGIDEAKLPSGAEAALADRLHEADLAATICTPAVITVLPRPANDRGSADPQERVTEMLAGIERLAPFRPELIFCATGPAGALSGTDARRVVVGALRRLADAAAEHGASFGLEIMRESFQSTWTIVSSLRDGLDLLAEVDRPHIGFVFDTWHMWDSQDVHEVLPEAAEHILGVQIADYRDPTRAVRDRVAAGEGVAGIPLLLRELRGTGYDGWYDMEIFSDTDLDGSLWLLPPEEFARRQVTAFEQVWAQSEAGDPA